MSDLNQAIRLSLDVPDPSYHTTTSSINTSIKKMGEHFGRFYLECYCDTVERVTKS